MVTARSGSRLKLARQVAGLSRRKLGALAQVDPGTIGKLEMGVNLYPNWDTAHRIAGVLKVDPNDLFDVPTPQTHWIRRKKRSA